MVFSFILGAMLLAASVTAAPAGSKATRTITKRTAPVIADGFTPQQTTQITDGIFDALELASYVVSLPAEYVDPVLEKYFNSGDLQTVKDVMNTLLGGNASSDVGNDFLAQITISPDFADADGDMTCDDDSTMAELRDWSTPNPTLILCNPAAFGHGGIGKGYDDPVVAAVGCDNFDPRVSWKMETLGSILLHEYTHWLPLMISPNGPLSKETDDEDGGYGPSGVRSLDKTLATNNADSYSWAATENLWTIICGTQYGDPDESQGDDDDPNCGGTVCTAPKGP